MSPDSPSLDPCLSILVSCSSSADPPASQNRDSAAGLMSSDQEIRNKTWITNKNFIQQK